MQAAGTCISNVSFYCGNFEMLHKLFSHLSATLNAKAYHSARAVWHILLGEIIILISLKIGISYPSYSIVILEKFCNCQSVFTVPLHSYVKALESEIEQKCILRNPILVEGISDVVINGTELGLGGYLDIGLYDTMEDLFINFLGAAAFSLIGFADARRGEKSLLTRQLVPRVKKDE